MSKFLHILQENLPISDYNNIIAAKLRLVRAINNIDGFTAQPQKGTGKITIITDTGDKFDISIDSIHKIKQEESEDDIEIAVQGAASKIRDPRAKEAIRKREKVLGSLRGKIGPLIKKYDDTTNTLQQIKL